MNFTIPPRFAVALLTSFLGLASSAWAQISPDRPVRIITASGPGSATDLAARAIADKLSAALKAPVIVENRPGAQGRIAQKYVLDAPADGHALYTYSPADSLGPALVKDFPHDPLKAFAAVAPLGLSPNVLVVAPSSGYKSLKELVDAGKGKPDALSYGSVGAGSASFMNAEKFGRAAGLKLLHVPFKGGADAMNEVVAGRVTLFFSSVSTAQSQIKAGRLLPLAMGTESRSPLLPGVPTLAEAGVPNADYAFWIGLVASAKTPSGTLDALSDAVSKIMSDAQTRQRFDDLGYLPMVLTRQQFGAFIVSEAAGGTAIVRESGIKTD